VSLCLQHEAHPAFAVEKLWSYFVPVPPSASTRRGLERLYVSSGFEVRPVLEAILRHPALHRGPRMVKPPVVYTAGLLRGLGRGVDTSAWVWLAGMAGQRLFYPPNVAGWEDDRWLDTATFRGRWYVANYALSAATASEKPARTVPNDPDAIVAGALRLLGSPTIRPATRRAVNAFARASLRQATGWKAKAYPPLVANAVRQLLAVSPDLITS
jgi:uncharacterized protein (DUF1800 family)